jgi:hypothetical protein
MNSLVLALGMGALLAPVAQEKLHVGDIAPNIEGEWFQSAEESLAEMRGRVVLVDFWRTW